MSTSLLTNKLIATFAANHHISHSRGSTDDILGRSRATPLSAVAAALYLETNQDVVASAAKATFGFAESVLSKNPFTSLTSFRKGLYVPATAVITRCQDYRESAYISQRVGAADAKRKARTFAAKLRSQLDRLCSKHYKVIWNQHLRDNQERKSAAANKKDDDDDDDGDGDGDDGDGDGDGSDAAPSDSGLRKRARPQLLVAGADLGAMNRREKEAVRQRKRQNRANAQKYAPAAKKSKKAAETIAAPPAAEKKLPKRLAEAALEILKTQLRQRAAVASAKEEKVVELQRELARYLAEAEAAQAEAEETRRNLHDGLGGGTVVGQALDQLKRLPLQSGHESEKEADLLAELRARVKAWEVEAVQEAGTAAAQTAYAKNGYFFTENCSKGGAMAATALRYVTWRARQPSAHETYTSVAGNTRAYGNGDASAWKQLDFVSEAFGRVVRALCNAPNDKGRDADFWATPAVPFIGPLGLIAQLAHQDIVSSRGHSFHFPLLDASAKSSTMLFPGTHDISKLDAPAHAGSPLEKTSFEMKAGSFLIFSTRLWHYGQAITDSLQVRLFSYIEEKGAPLTHGDVAHATIAKMVRMGYNVPFVSMNKFDNGAKVYCVDIKSR